jgi:hypothetical protein
LKYVLLFLLASCSIKNNKTDFDKSLKALDESIESLNFSTAKLECTLEITDFENTYIELNSKLLKLYTSSQVELLIDSYILECISKKYNKRI